MNTYEYRVFYQWDGPSKSDPFAKEKSSAEIDRALREFPNELGHRLQDLEARVETSEVREGVCEVHLRVQTKESQESVERALATTLSDWCLYGDFLHAHASG